MTHFSYLILMGLCLVVTVPLEAVIGARVYRRPLRAAAAIVPTVVVFGAWDLVAIHRGSWTYNPEYVTGAKLPGKFPVEELVFFVVIPLCALLTYETVGTLMGRLRRTRTPVNDDA
jgi:lycopene cyclase domain-containing protein